MFEITKRSAVGRSTEKTSADSFHNCGDLAMYLLKLTLGYFSTGGKAMPGRATSKMSLINALHYTCMFLSVFFPFWVIHMVSFLVCFSRLFATSLQCRFDASCWPPVPDWTILEIQDCSGITLCIQQ